MAFFSDKMQSQTEKSETESTSAVLTVGGQPVNTSASDDNENLSSLIATAADRRRQRLDNVSDFPVGGLRDKQNVTSYCDSAHCFDTKETKSQDGQKTFSRAYGKCKREGCNVTAGTNPFNRECVGAPNVKWINGQRCWITIQD